MASQFYIAPWNGTLGYSQYDIVYGINTNATYPSPYFYATQNVPAGYSPSGVYNYPITQYSRVGDITTLTYTHTGGLPMAPGSIINVTGVSANSTVNFTGMVMQGGSGTLSYVNAGWDQTQSVSVGAIHCLCPAWTTGFFFIPTYTSKFPVQNKTITATLGDGYEQRSPDGLNPFSQNPTFVYQNIDKRQAKALVNYVQDANGRAVEILTNDVFLQNQPNLKYTLLSVEPEPVSFERYNVMVNLRRVFDL